MNAITITLSDERLLKLKEMAKRFGIMPEELVRLSVEDLLTISTMAHYVGSLEFE